MCGFSHGAYYHYFDSKEELFREVAEIQEARLTAPPDDPELNDSRGDSALERIRKANRRYLLRYRDEARIMGVIEQVSRYDAPVNEVRMARQKHFAERSERAIRRWQEEGIADPGIDAALAADVLGAMVLRRRSCSEKLPRSRRRGSPRLPTIQNSTMRVAIPRWNASAKRIGGTSCAIGRKHGSWA